MPNPILLNVPTASASYLADCKKGMEVAAALGYSGVRFSAGLSNYGTATGVNTDHLKAAVEYAVSLGLKCSILLNLGPRFDGGRVMELNGGVPLPVPTLPTAQAVLDYVADGWQDFVNRARTVAPDSALEWEWLNEPGIGGNQDPLDYDPDTRTYSHGTYSGPSGTIVPAFFQSLEYVSSRVNFYGCETVAFTLEGESTAVAQTEVNSVTGSNAASVIARATSIGTNRYGDEPATPYDAAATKAAFSTKVQQQLTRMAANPLIGAKPVKIREFGLHRDRRPRCRSANTVRNDLVAQMKVQSGLVSAAFFCFTDMTGNKQANSEFYFYAFNRDKTPLDGIAVGP